MSWRPARRVEGLGISALRAILAEAPPDAIHLGLGQVARPVPAPIARAVVTSSAREHATYGPNAGNPALRARIAARYDVDPARVIVTAGVQEAVALTLLASLNDGDEVLLPDPAFSVYETLARIAGAVVRRYPLRPEHHFRPNTADVLAQLTDATRGVVVVSPGNPTGAAATPEEWAQLGESLSARHVTVLSDEIYVDLQLTDAPHPSMLAHVPDAFVTSGLSKSHALAGWRLGWLVTPDAAINPVTGLHQHLVTSASTLVQDAALAAFEVASVAWRDQLVADLRVSSRAARTGLEAAGFEVHGGEGGLFLWARPASTPHPIDEVAFVRALMKAGVVTIPGSAFGPGGKGWIRVAHAVDSTQLATALTRIDAHMKTFVEARS